MKRIMVLLLLAAMIFLFGCNNVVLEQKDNVLRQFIEEPVTIVWNGDKNDGIQSYQANVKVYSMNNRKDHAARLTQTYRIGLKIIDDRIVTRIDFDADEGRVFRSIIYDGEEAVVFNPSTDEIGYRIPLEDSKSPLYRIFANQSGVSRINLSLIREEARRLSLDIQEGTDGNSDILLLELPPAMIPQNGLDKITRSRAVFDITHEILLETEVIMVREDETLVTTTVTPLYEKKNGEFIKIGQKTIIDSKAPYLIEGIDPDIEIFNSPDDIPTLTESELAEFQQKGEIHELPGILFGDPADLSYVETIYEVYHDIEINTMPDDLFRLIQK